MAVPSYQYVNVELHGHFVIVKYSRPQSGNALHPDLISETGDGKFFCTGMELADVSSATPVAFSMGSDFHTLNKILITSEIVLIAAFNGPAAGYGVSSPALFDLVYSIPDAYLFTQFVNRGMAAEGASNVSFAKIMGHQKTAALFLTGEPISASEADYLGLVTKILPKEQVLQDIVEIATRISSSPPSALKPTKALMKNNVEQDLLDVNDRECTLLQSERFQSDGYYDAIKQFKGEQGRKKAAAGSKL